MTALVPLLRSIALVALLALGRVPLAAQSGPEVARAFREANEISILRDFTELLSYPNRARDTEDIRRAAAYIRDELLAVGVNSELLEIEGAPPIVYGEVMVPGAVRTLGIYAHYDGQPGTRPAGPIPLFEPTFYTAAMEAGGEPRMFPEEGEAVDPEWRIYARSAGDDKAPIAAILPVLRSFREAGIAPTSNLIFFLDGEEEAGSPHLASTWSVGRTASRISTSGSSSTAPRIRVAGLRWYSASVARWGWRSRSMARAGISTRGTTAIGRPIPATFSLAFSRP